MLNYIKITERGHVPNLRGGLGMLNRAKKAAYAESGRHWHTLIRPRHFQNAATAAYDYAPRKGSPGRPDPYGFQKSYVGGKLKKFGHTRPLTKSGESQSQTDTATISATSQGVRVRMSAGWIGYQGNRGHEIDLADEMVRLNQADAEEIAVVWSRTMHDTLDAEVYTHITNL